MKKFYFTSFLQFFLIMEYLTNDSQRSMKGELRKKKLHRIRISGTRFQYQHSKAKEALAHSYPYIKSYNDCIHTFWGVQTIDF